MGRAFAILLLKYLKIKLKHMKLKSPSNKNQCPSNFSVYSVYKLLHAAVYTDADYQDHMFAEREPREIHINTLSITLTGSQ